MVVAGGDTRRTPSRAALAALPADVDVVLVHDAARPLVPRRWSRPWSPPCAAGADAVVPGLPVADTVKPVDAADVVVATLDRAGCARPDPAGLPRATLLDAAHARRRPRDAPATDDAGLVERAGGTVVVVPGDEEAFKVTRPLDLVLAEAVLARRRAAGVVA